MYTLIVMLSYQWFPMNTSREELVGKEAINLERHFTYKCQLSRAHSKQ